MKDDQGFTKKQKAELGEMFSDLFKEVVLPVLEMSTVEMKSYLNLKARVSVLERRVGIAAL